MTTSDTDSAVMAAVKPAGTDGSGPAGPPPDKPAIPAKAKNQITMQMTASETLPTSTRGAVMGLINACGNLGGLNFSTP